jgi:hypothetical protein
VLVSIPGYPTRGIETPNMAWSDNRPRRLHPVAQLGTSPLHTPELSMLPHHTDPTLKCRPYLIPSGQVVRQIAFLSMERQSRKPWIDLNAMVGENHEYRPLDAIN